MCKHPNLVCGLTLSQSSLSTYIYTHIVRCVSLWCSLTTLSVSHEDILQNKLCRTPDEDSSPWFKRNEKPYIPRLRSLETVSWWGRIGRIKHIITRKYFSFRRNRKFALRENTVHTFFLSWPLSSFYEQERGDMATYFFGCVRWLTTLSLIVFRFCIRIKACTVHMLNFFQYSHALCGFVFFFGRTRAIFTLFQQDGHQH